MEKHPSSKNKKLSTLVIAYLLIGLFFALYFMFYYQWRVTAIFSPGFYVVILTWPYQILGMIPDIQQYGWGGKPF